MGNEPLTDNRSVLTVTEAARYLRVSESIVRRLIREQRIPFFRIEGRYLLHRPALDSWIEERTVKPETESAITAAKKTADRIWTSKEEH